MICTHVLNRRANRRPAELAGAPVSLCAPTARRHLASRNRLQAPAAYLGEVRRPSCRARASADEGIPSELHGQVERNRLQPPAAIKEID